MATSLDNNKATLLNGILLAGSDLELNRLAHAAMADFKTHKLHAGMALQFAEDVLTELAGYSPMKTDPQQWSNINAARVLFRRIRNNLIASAN